MAITHLSYKHPIRTCWLPNLIYSYDTELKQCVLSSVVVFV